MSTLLNKPITLVIYEPPAEIPLKWRMICWFLNRLNSRRYRRV